MMICQNCGTQNVENSRFCIKCGLPLSSIETQNMNGSVNNNPSFQPQLNSDMINNTNNPSVNSIHQQPVTSSQNASVRMSLIEYFKTLFAVILKPFTTFKNEISKFDNFKNSAILSIIIAIFSTVVSLLNTMYNTVRVTTGGWFSEEKTEWVWENLKEIEYVKVIGMNLLTFLGIILAIAVVYYIASLLVKKNTNFSRLLGIAAISVVPMFICSLVLSPLLMMLYEPLGMAITIVGSIYTLIMIYETMNNEILLEGNAKYYFNLICLSILLLAGYYIYMKIFTSPLSDVSDILDLLG